MVLFNSCNPKDRQRMSSHRMLFASFITPESRDYDFGTIKESDENVNHIFVFKNSKKEKIYISKIPTLCPCLSVNYPKKGINPGETFGVKVIYDPKNRKGFFYHQIMIIFNDGKYFINPTIKGIVSEL